MPRLLLALVLLTSLCRAAFPELLAPSSSAELKVFQFAIRKAGLDASGNIQLSLVATDKGQNVGIDVILDKSWKPASAKLPTHRTGNIHWKTTGPESEALAKALATHLKVKAPKYAEHTATMGALSTGAAPSEIQTKVITLQIYSGAIGGDDFTGMLLQFDLAAKYAVLQEQARKYPPQDDVRKRFVKLIGGK